MLQIRKELQLQHIFIRASANQRGKLHNSDLTTPYEPVNRRFHSSAVPSLPGPPVRASLPCCARHLREHLFPEPQDKGAVGGGLFIKDQFLRGQFHC